eukprot:scaffold87728_cov63-Phaeocystis_antarctica.AAC.1
MRARRSLCTSGAAEAVGAQPSEAKAAERSHAGDGDVGHARVEAARRLGVIDSGVHGMIDSGGLAHLHRRGVERHALALMDGHGPGRLEWQLQPVAHALPRHLQGVV